MNVPYGYCHCGCGEKTTVPTETTGTWKRGVPMKYLKGHHSRGIGIKNPNHYIEEDCGYKTPCWTWQRSLTDGYGKITVPGQGEVLAHRWFYERDREPIPEGLTIDHLCRNRACVNPDHLEVVTNAENQRRGDNAKLTWEDAREIRRIGASERRAVLAERYGVTVAIISRVLRGVAWIEEEANAA